MNSSVGGASGSGDQRASAAAAVPVARRAEEENHSVEFVLTSLLSYLSFIASYWGHYLCVL